MALTGVANINGTKNVVKKGTALITAEPFAFVLSSQYKKERCDYCFKSCKVARCSGCQDVHYCGRICQKKAWTIHKIECPGIKKVRPRVIPDAAKMMGRIAIKISLGGETERGYYTDEDYRTFFDLMSHIQDIRQDAMKLEHFTSLSMILFEILPKDVLPGPKELLGIFGRMSVNSFNILDTDMTSLGVGIYLGPSIVDHSCKPNAAAVFEGTKITLRALCDLPALDWSKIFIPYIDLLKNTDARRADLQRAYYFRCECERCNTPETIEISAACPNKKCTNPCSSLDTVCNKCGEKFPPEFKERFDDVSDMLTYQLDKMQHTAYVDATKLSLQQQEGILHPYNLLVVRMLEMAITASIDLNYWDDAETYAAQLIPKYLYYFGDSHPMTGQMYFLWGKLLSFLNKGKQALEVTTRAAQIIRTAFGENHSILKNEVKPLIDQLITEYNILNDLDD